MSPGLCPSNGKTSPLGTQSRKHVNCDTTRGCSALQAGFRLLESRECSAEKLAEAPRQAANPRELYYRISLQVYGKT